MVCKIPLNNSTKHAFAGLQLWNHIKLNISLVLSVLMSICHQTLLHTVSSVQSVCKQTSKERFGLRGASCRLVIWAVFITDRTPHSELLSQQVTGKEQWQAELRADACQAAYGAECAQEGPCPCLCGAPQRKGWGRWLSTRDKAQLVTLEITPEQGPPRILGCGDGLATPISCPEETELSDQVTLRRSYYTATYVVT